MATPSPSSGVVDGACVVDGDTLGDAEKDWYGDDDQTIALS